MREIIFRGKRIDIGYWVYGYLIKTHNGQCYIMEEPMFIPGLTMPREKFIEVVPETVGQYTTFKNKDGKKIYEDDCLEYAGCILLIGWYGYRWGYGIIKGSLMRPPRLLDIVDQTRTIGNIIDNPDFFEATK